jgi:RNA polymerase sigma factor (sigma-70 family)
MHASPNAIEIDDAGTTDDGLSVFLRARPRLFGIAHRMLGSAAEAEDIVQDVWLRWQTLDRGPIRNPLAFLVTATTRLALNVINSARNRREIGVGPSFPETVDPSDDPGIVTERSEALASVMGLLMERLPPAERAAFVLREAFNYPYRQLADLLQVEEANARQIVSRARVRVSGERRTTVSAADRRRILDAFSVAARTGDLSRLEHCFVSDAAVMRHNARRQSVHVS